MAGKILSRPSYGALLHCCKSVHVCNTFICVRNYRKKQYNYDLDSLIQWNKDTALAFGAQIKFTKTGKVRKNRKNPNTELTYHLEVLKAMSASVPITVNHCHEHIDESLKKPRFRDGKEEYVSENIPEYCFEHQVPDYEHSPQTSSSSSKKIYHRQMTEDGIFIPEIKPVPQRSTNKKVKQQNDGWLLEERVNDSFNNRNSSFEKLSRSKLEPHKPQSENQTSQERLIDPQLEMRQSSTETGSTRESSTNIASQSNSSPSSLDLPVEPPESFSIINEFPLAFDEEGSHVQHLSSKLQAYKVDIGKLGLRTLPPVKSILSKTMPELNRFFLNRWREGMIKELGEEGFKLHQEATIKKGINLHANIMEVLSGKLLPEIQVMPDNEGHMASLQTAMSLISDVKALEAEVKHPYLNYRGVFDCVARYKCHAISYINRDLLCVIDWKSSKKPRPLLKNTYDDPLQIAAYVGAVNATNNSENHCRKINHGVIVVAYPDGSPAHIHMMNRTQCEHYWRDWTDRLYNYYQLIFSSKFG